MIAERLEGLIKQALKTELIEPADEIYTRNRILALLKFDSIDSTGSYTDDSIPNLLEKIIEDAIERQVIEDVFDDKEIFSAEIMDCFIARPSVINAKFQQKYKANPKDATDYFYELSKNSNYIQMNRIRKNIQFKAETKYGEMDITINMSKPEKDPKQIKREKVAKKDINYPACVLCIENEGYAGRTAYPARANHRVIQIPLEGENWYFQYSPYVYYNEHSILLSEKHRDMKINPHTFQRLLSFIEQFPHYFIGSNADLPIVGGSILSHDHYQAGNYAFPMTNASTKFQFSLENFSNVSMQALEWPLATIRLRSSDKEAVSEAAAYILNEWKNYSDVDANIIAFTDDTPHNTVTPIARMRGNEFELDIVLRNNRTSKEHPLGIFHPHADVHHIKRENIGLIEVMGLAVLPARLNEELEEISHYLRNKQSGIADYHLEWAQELLEKHGEINNKNEANEILKRELGYKFARVLGDAGVFKNNGAWQRFLAAISAKVSD
ncbi:UDP-glucose--hexose-1-phosphate uridylyltransferase [Sporosarcina pasteurii]|uniref:Galactose-1-phosphate uridylyltransferase n=1 Tax=Sporosarcina pasteurii TaxID=1474 RepID=A0A380BEE3_SPOPA|nr:UDP-glucose--hexose-1-phosphate uridylyltransferase [Sporosarcina pasteurii]MDS9472495.1 UDP-glucose--hexose-1-phosphate uridylyltransferase [Sporosarcina pasteurii]QBQ06050.1 UDP-glucose--hexose-1-phosphate uridylyltransferase [Sporosarcina pasteurii]SUI99623.1 galactose-1-phosphate uridylyltransferase [Sporosarcina pasteurii]